MGFRAKGDAIGEKERQMTKIINLMTNRIFKDKIREYRKGD